MREAIELLCAQVGADYGVFRADAFARTTGSRMIATLEPLPDE